jgi:hypothetical protein
MAEIQVQSKASIEYLDKELREAAQRSAARWEELRSSEELLSKVLASAEGSGEPEALSGGGGAVEARFYRVARVAVAGKLDGWGWGMEGMTPENVPVGLQGVIAVSAGRRYRLPHSLALRNDGTVVAWGWNEDGQTSVPSGLNDVIAIAAGNAHSLALREDGTVVAWGWNGYGQTQVPPEATDVVGITAGSYHNLALKRDGTVIGWGDDAYGALDIPLDLTDVAQVAAGDGLSYALLSNGTVRAWGSGGLGPVTVPPGLANVVQIAAAHTHGLALKFNGEVEGLGPDTGWGETLPPSGLDNVLQVSAGYMFSLALRNDGSVVAWGRDDYGQTTVPEGLGDTKMVAAGGFHALALAYSPTLMYPVNVAQDLLVIYNSNCQDSITIKDYYLAHRPSVSGANVLGIGGADTVLEDYADFDEVTNTLVVPILDWLSANPTKRPEYYVLCYGIPNRTTHPDDSNLAIFSSAAAIRGALSGRLPRVTSLNQATTSDCIAYIDKLAAMANNLPPGRVWISAQAAGYDTLSYVLDNIRDGFYSRSDSAALQRNAREGLLESGVNADDILYADNWAGISYLDPWPINPNHIRNATNVAAYVCWGQHGWWPPDWPTGISLDDGQPYIRFHENGGWYLIQSIESWNGRWSEASIRIAWQSSYQMWFSSGAFGGSNYGNTPIGAVSHVSEPGGVFSVNDTRTYFGLWQAGKGFAIAAYMSKGKQSVIQATGDPFVRK